MALEDIDSCAHGAASFELGSHFLGANSGGFLGANSAGAGTDAQTISANAKDFRPSTHGTGAATRAARCDR